MRYKYNIHISTHNSVTNPTRILKETKSLADSGIFDKIIIIGQAAIGLPNYERIDSKREIIRIEYPIESWVLIKDFIYKYKRMLSSKNKTTNHNLTIYHDKNIQTPISITKEMKLLKYLKSYIWKLLKYLFYPFRKLSQLLRKKKIEKLVWLECKNFPGAVISAHSYLHISLVYKIVRKLKGFAVYDIHELESHQFGVSVKQAAKIVQLEKKYLKKYDAIFVVSEEIKKWYCNNYRKIKMPVVVRNIPAKWQIMKKSDDTDFKKIFNIDENKILLLYNGRLTKERGINLLLKVASKKELSKKYTFIFMGYGPMEEDIIRIAETSSNIFFHKAVPPDQILNYTQSADLGFSILFNSCLNHNFALPNKLFEYFSAGLGIIGGVTESQKKFIQSYELGQCVKEESEIEYLELLNSLSFEEIQTYKENSLKLIKTLCWENEAEIMKTEYLRFMNE